MSHPYASKDKTGNKQRAKAHKMAGHVDNGPKLDSSLGYASPFKHSEKATTGVLLEPSKTYAAGGKVYKAGAGTGEGRIEKKNKYGL